MSKAPQEITRVSNYGYEKDLRRWSYHLWIGIGVLVVLLLLVACVTLLIAR